MFILQKSDCSYLPYQMLVCGYFRPDNATNRLINVKKNEEMWNTVFKEHMTAHPKCKGFLSWDPKGEQQRGTAWMERAKCDLCSYVSKKFKLYEEVEDSKSRPGWKTAKTKISMQIGIMQTPVGNSALRKVFLSANVPAPSRAGLQNSSKYASKSVEKQNKSDMQQRCKTLLKANRYRNETNDRAIDVEGDGIYNNKLYSGVGKTPFQPSTQMVYTLAENSTPEKQIIACATKSKLYSQNGRHEGTCEEAGSPCTANIQMTDTFGNEKDGPWSV